MQIHFDVIFIILISSITTNFLVLPAKKIGCKFNIIDKPSKRKKFFKKVNITRSGGIALFSGLLLSCFLFNYLGWINTLDNKIIFYSLISSSCVFLIGLFDDIKNISPFPRLIAQIIIAIGIWKNLIQINSIDLSFVFPNIGTISLHPILSLISTVLVIVSITNSFNWQDGLDGLASGVSFLSSLGFALILLPISKDISFIYYILIISSISIGFLFHNFYPAKILMGDSGSYLLGINLSIFACFTYQELISSGYSKYSIFIPILVLFIPLIDMIWVVFSRIYEGRSPFFPDTRHFHYKLIRLGLTHLESVLVCYLLCIWFISLSLSITFIQYRYFVFASSIFIVIFSLLNLKKLALLSKNLKTIINSNQN